MRPEGRGDNTWKRLRGARGWGEHGSFCTTSLARPARHELGVAPLVLVLPLRRRLVHDYHALLALAVLGVDGDAADLLEVVGVRRGDRLREAATKAGHALALGEGLTDERPILRLQALLCELGRQRELFGAVLLAEHARTLADVTDG